MHLACGPTETPNGANGQEPVAKLPPEAKLAFAELTPAIPKPVNPPGLDDLPERAADVVARAERLLADHDAVGAAQLLERAKGFAPNSRRVLRNLGMAYDMMADPAKAKAALEASLKLGPDDLLANLTLARYAGRGGKLDRAILLLRRALVCTEATDANPDTGEAVLDLAAYLEKRGYLTAALESYQRLGRLVTAHGRAYLASPVLKDLVDKPEHILVSQGQVLHKLGRFPEAAKALERAYRGNKSDTSAAALAVRMLLKAKQLPRAREIVMEMLGSRSQQASGAQLASELCRAGDDPKLARQLLKTYFDRGGRDIGFVMIMANVVADMGAAKEAAAILSEYVTSMPKDNEVALYLAGLYGRTGDFAAAAELLASLLIEERIRPMQLTQAVKPIVAAGLTTDAVKKLSAAVAQKDQQRQPAFLCVVGVLAKAIGQKELALQSLRRGIHAGIHFWPAYELLADTYLTSGDLEALNDLGKRIDKVAPDGYFKYYFLAKIDLENGRIDEAVAKLEQALARRDGHVPTLLLLGRALVRQRKFPEARVHLSKALSLAPDDEEALREFVRLDVKRRRIEEAAETLAAFLRRHPKSIVARTLYARVLYQAGQADRARTRLAKLLTEAPKNMDVRVLEVQIHLPRAWPDEPIQADEAEAAFKRIDQLLAEAPGLIEVQVLKASLLSNQKRHAEAAAVWEAILARTLQDYEVVSGYLSTLIAAGRKKDVPAVVKRVVDAGPTTAATRLMLLERLLQVEAYEMASEFVETWLSEYSQEDQSTQANLYLLRSRAISVYRKVGQYGKAQKLLDGWIASGVRREILQALRRQKLEMYALAKDFDAAANYAEKWARNDNNKGIRVLLLQLLEEAKAYEKMHAVLDKWLDEETDKSMVGYFRIKKLELLGLEKKFDQMERYGKEWIALDPAGEMANAVLISELVDCKRFAQAMAVAEKWLAALLKLPATAPAVAESRAKMIVQVKGTIVSILMMSEQNAKAIAKAREFAKAEPKNPKLLNLVYSALMNADKELEAVAVLKKVYELDPTDPWTNNNLGYYWADKGINLPKAEAMIRLALGANASSLAMTDSLGWVLYKQGRFKDAKLVFDRLLESKKKLHAVIFDHAGDVYWRLGLKERERALELWGKAVEGAKALDKPSSDDRKVLAGTPKKIVAAKAAKPPKVAPLGEGVKEPAKPE